MNRDVIEAARGHDMLALAQAHGARLSRYTATEFVGPCPVCGTGNDRFSVNVKQQMFFCRVCNRGGHGAIDLEMFLAGSSFGKAVTRLTDGRYPVTRIATTPNAVNASKRERDARAANQHAKAAWLWHHLRQDAAGSPVETYLRGRGYIGTIPPTIGYLPARGEYVHAMISAFALPNEIEPGELGMPLSVRAVHLTKLNPDGSDRIRTEGKKIVGSPSGLPLAVSCIGDGLSLAITEGIEDAIAYADIGIGAWAAGSAACIPALAEHIPSYITTVIIEQHPDASAQHAVTQLKALLEQRLVREGERPIKLLIREAWS